MPRWLFRRFMLPLYRRWALKQMQADQNIHFHGLRLHIPSGIFHPGLFFSSGIFLAFLEKQQLKGKVVLDVGCGSGVLGLFCAKKGARVYALDLNPSAVKTTLENARRNKLSNAVHAFESNLLDALPANHDFSPDYILVNPPYYAKNAENMAENAFFAGENLTYFRKFFPQIKPFTSSKCLTWLVLSEDCPMPELHTLAKQNGLILRCIHERKKWGERIGIWQVTPQT